MTGPPLTLALPDELLEELAERVADLLAERNAPTEAEGFLDVTDAAAFLSCKSSRVYALTSSGRLPHYKDGSRLLFDRDELRAYVANGGARRP